MPSARYKLSGFKCLVPGTKYLIWSTWYPVIDTQHLSQSTWYQVMEKPSTLVPSAVEPKWLVPSTCYRVLGKMSKSHLAPRCLVPGSIECQTLGTNTLYQVLGTKYLVLTTSTTLSINVPFVTSQTCNYHTLAMTTKAPNCKMPKCIPSWCICICVYMVIVLGRLGCKPFI